MNNFYNEILTEHNVRPEFKYDLECPTIQLEGVNPNCGDDIWLSLVMKDGVIQDVKFKTFGCGAAIATSSMATEMVKGKSIEEAMKLTNKAVAEALDGLPPVKMHCSLLAEQALKEALEDYFKKNNLPLPEGFEKPDAEHEEIPEEA